MKPRPRSPDLYVLDALANDIEDLESILRMLNSDTALGWVGEWGRAFHRAELVESLSRLIARGHVRVLALAPDGKSLEPLPDAALPRGNYEEVYVAMTDRGRLVHRNWHPARDGEDVASDSAKPNETVE